MFLVPIRFCRPIFEKQNNTLHHKRRCFEKYCSCDNAGNKAKGVFQENKARQIFRKTKISHPLIRRANLKTGVLKTGKSLTP